MLGVGGWDSQREDPKGSNRIVMAVVIILVLGVFYSNLYERGCFTQKRKVEKNGQKKLNDEATYKSKR